MTRNKITNIIQTLFLIMTIYSCNDHRNSVQVNSDSIKTVDLAHLSQKMTHDTLAVAYGDLNSDNISDLVVILKEIGEDTTFHSPAKRPIQILFGKNDHSYSLFCSSDNVVMTHDMGGASTPDPFTSLKISQGILTVEHHGGMGSFHWVETTSFKYSIADKVFYVDKIENVEGKYSDEPSEAFEKTTIETSKDFGKVTLDKYSIFDNQE